MLGSTPLGIASPLFVVGECHLKSSFCCVAPMGKRMGALAQEEHPGKTLQTYSKILRPTYIDAIYIIVAADLMTK